MKPCDVRVKEKRHGGRLLGSGQKWRQGFSLQTMCLILMGVIQVVGEPRVTQETDGRTTSEYVKTWSWSMEKP